MAEEAAAFKAAGNTALAAKDFDAAIENYTKAIELNPLDHVFFSNRSAAYLSKGDGESALEDAEQCIKLNASFAKGFSRKGAALHALRSYDEAIAAYEAGLAVAPGDAGLQSGLEDARKAKSSTRQSPPGGGLGGLFGPQMIAKLAGHPKFGPKLNDPTFKMKLQMMQTNPQVMFCVLPCVCVCVCVCVLFFLVGGFIERRDDAKHTHTHTHTHIADDDAGPGNDGGALGDSRSSG